MTCHKATDCGPCADCDPPVQPILPRCQDIVIPDGRYTNATIVVENGCISVIENGTPMLYQPDNYCATLGGGGGRDGLDGEPGPPGQNATIEIGAVSSGPPGSAPSITNTGTPTAAILNFVIPRGEPGKDGETIGGGVTNSDAGFEIEQGLIKILPPTWPPVMTVLDTANSDTLGASLTFSKDANGLLSATLSLAAFEDMLKAYVDAAVSALQTQLSQAQVDIATIQTNCCP